MRSSRLVSFLLMFVVYVATMYLYLDQTHSIIIDETEKNIENTLLSQRALGTVVSHIQKPEIYKLKIDGVLDKDYFSPALLSSSYITIKLNEYANVERKKLGIAPMLYKYASPNPMNPENLADHFELNVFKKFQTTPIRKYKEIITENGKNYLYYAIAGKIMEKQCLACHGDPENAPKSLVKIYGSDNGFGYKTGQLSSIISIRAPLEGIYEENDRQFYAVAGLIFLIFVTLFFAAELFKTRLEKKEQAIEEERIKSEARKQHTRALESSLENLYEHVISSQFDMKGKIISVSDALLRLCGYSREELIGQSFCFFKHPDTPETLFQDIWKALADGGRWKGEVKNISKTGEVFWVEVDITPMKDEHNITFAFESVMRVITEKKALLEDINIDPLTSLLNRRSFEKRFEVEKNRAKRDQKYFALLMIDIDFFKQYNDHYGHVKGDDVLQKVSRNLERSFRRSSDLIFRLGGEEFAVLTSEKSIGQLIDSAQNACSKLQKECIQHLYSDICPCLTISIGMAILPQDSTLGLEEVYEKSDEALYKAKENGRNQVQVVEL